MKDRSRGRHEEDGERRPEDRHHHRGGPHKRKEHHRGAKTFRRGRALEFLERLNVKRETLKQQLDSPELQSINPIIVGELKAIEMVMNEFTHLFDIHEEELKGIVIEETSENGTEEK